MPACVGFLVSSHRSVLMRLFSVNSVEMLKSSSVCVCAFCDGLGVFLTAGIGCRTPVTLIRPEQRLMIPTHCWL